MLVFYKEIINYDAPSGLEEVIGKDKFIYNKIKGMKEKNDQRIKKNFNPFVTPRNMDNFLRPPVAPSGSRVTESPRQKENIALQCWNCEGNHYARECPAHKKLGAKLSQIQEATAIEDVGRNVPRIYATLDNQQTKQQSRMI